MILEKSPHGPEHERFANKLHEEILKAQYVLGIGDVEMSEAMRLTLSEWLSHKRWGNPPTFFSLTSFCQVFDVSLDTIVRGTVDWNAIKRRRAGNLMILPERYEFAAFSKARTSLYMLSYIDTFFGSSVRKRILKNLQIDELALSDPDKKVSINLNVDICEQTIQMGGDGELLQQMGQFSAVANRSTEVMSFFKDCRTDAEVYEKIIPMLNLYFERNYRYRIVSMSKDACVISSTSNPEVTDLMKSSKVGSIAACWVRTGVAGSFPAYIGRSIKQVKHTRCLHQGDSECVFEIKLD